MDLEVVAPVDRVDSVNLADMVALVAPVDRVDRADMVGRVGFTDGSGHVVDMAAVTDRTEVVAAVYPDVCCTSSGLPVL